ncbi:hypothetical protein ACX0G9_19330 [Flavitalea flava]
MKKTNLIATAALATIAVTLAGSIICMARKNKQQKRLAAIANEGYELAYDIHYPVTYKKK